MNEPEIGQPGIAESVDENVAGLDVPMHDALRVHVIEGPRDVLHDPDRAVDLFRLVQAT